MSTIPISNNNGSLNNWIKNFLYNQDVLDRQTKGMSATDKAAAMQVFDAASKEPLSFGKLNVAGNAVDNSGIGTSAKLAFNKMKAHPFKTAGLGLLGAGNVAGLFDNNKIGGQLVGTGVGTAVPFLANKFMGTKFGLPGKLGFAMGGGFMGSLFDKLMAAKEQEQDMYNQYQGQY